MIRKSFCFVLILILIFSCTACGKTAYDFDKMEKRLEKESGETYDIVVNDTRVVIRRTDTLPEGGRNREKIANLSQEEFDEWVNSIIFLIYEEENEFNEAFKNDGSDYDVRVILEIIDADGNEIGTIRHTGSDFTLEDLQPYSTNDSKEYVDESQDELSDEIYGNADVQAAILNTHAILENYLYGRSVQFDTESLIVMAENIDEVLASDLLSEKPLSITNDGYVVEIEYDKAVISWELGAEASQVSVVEK